MDRESILSCSIGEQWCIVGRNVWSIGEEGVEYRGGMGGV